MASTRKSFIQRLFGCSASKPTPESVPQPKAFEQYRSYEPYHFQSVWEGKDTTILKHFRWVDEDSGLKVEFNDTELRFDLFGWSHGYLIPSIRHFRSETCKYATDPELAALVDEIVARHSDCKWKTSSADDINGFIRRAAQLIGAEDYWLNHLHLMASPLVSAWVELRETGRKLGPITEFMDLDSYLKVSCDTALSAPVKEQMKRYLQTLPDYTESSPLFGELSHTRHGHIQTLLTMLVAPSDGREVVDPVTPRYRRDDVCLGYRSKRPIGSVSVVAEGGVYQIELTHPSNEFKLVAVSLRD